MRLKGIRTKYIVYILMVCFSINGELASLATTNYELQPLA